MWVGCGEGEASNLVHEVLRIKLPDPKQYMCVDSYKFWCSHLQICCQVVLNLSFSATGWTLDVALGSLFM